MDTKTSSSLKKTNGKEKTEPQPIRREKRLHKKTKKNITSNFLLTTYKMVEVI